MLQEYLVKDDATVSELEKHVLNNNTGIKEELLVQFKVTKLCDSDSRIVSLWTKGNNRNTAKNLSGIDRWIKEQTKVVVLTNESSAYFNKALFPIINDFERNLRTLLYLMASIHKEKEAANNIRELEEKDLGELFELLFTDAEFVVSVKKKINNKSRQFSKDELLHDIISMKENTLWGLLIGNEKVPTLCKHYSDIKDFRNDVMHAHNINYHTFVKARSIFIKVNDELKMEIKNVIRKQVDVPLSFNEKLKDYLNTFTSPIDGEEMVSLLNSFISPEIKKLAMDPSLPYFFTKEKLKGWEQLKETINMLYKNQEE